MAPKRSAKEPEPVPENRDNSMYGLSYRTQSMHPVHQHWREKKHPRTNKEAFSVP